MLERVITVYAEETPNPRAMKFVANKLIYNGSLEFKTVKEAVGISPLAEQLFQFNVVEAVFIFENFVTIHKAVDADWYEIMPIIREFIKSFIESGEPSVIGTPTLQDRETSQAPIGDGSAEDRIKSVIDEYIRPAIESDGGDISYLSFEEGMVKVKLKGACSGCPSSTVTLKNGIENLLKKMVPEVEGVISE